MSAGIAGAVLIFVAIWHLTEWMMSHRDKDTLVLIPFGVLYAILGYLIVNLIGGKVVLAIALICVSIGMTAAITVRKTSSVRPWVMRAFILIDMVIITCLILALLA
ncbi:hypothetical protein GCM10008927_15850 [Amylibacter ulvae]|uniref:Uncharacterized protein n=1 Tax=Paramylibacter ulvae TaxID=1651968 RepID=A0ABQ3D5H1_9RHOB|nr:hypothetical protein [Amylibacter ulvae]GHA51334.1 hypothetical protein GCM10008927_15850 [Amylibacter ulvae]